MVYLSIISTIQLLLIAYIGYRYFVNPPKVKMKIRKEDLQAVIGKQEYGQRLNTERFGDKK